MVKAGLNTKDIGMIRQIIGLSAVAFLITSCSTMAPTTTPLNTSWDKRTQDITTLKNWGLNGKIGIQSAKDSGSATIDWTQRGQSFAISLTGPLGSNGMTLTGQPGSVKMTTSDGKQATATSPEQLLKQQWGWNLPVSNLSFWVRGLPAPGMSASKQFDQHHRLTAMTQQDWVIQYLGYTNASGIELPNRINISSNALKAKFVIYEWQIN